MELKLLKLAAFAILSLLFACGKQNVKKEYILHIDTEDETIVAETTRLIEEFNRQAGAKILNIAANPEQATSTIKFDPNLETTHGKIGYGQWITKKSKNKALALAPHGRKVSYSMSLEFDENYFANRAGLDKSDPEWQELFLLFCHEVGHGLKFDHHHDKSDVMYPFISAKKSNFQAYFANVVSWVGH